MAELDRAIDAHMKKTGDDWDLEAKFPPPDFLTHAEADVYLEKEVLKRAAPTELFNNAAVILEKQSPKLQEDFYIQALTALQKAHKSHSFGLCKTCKYFTTTQEGFFCGLTKEPLTQSDSEKICQEHTAV